MFFSRIFSVLGVKCEKFQNDIRLIFSLLIANNGVFVQRNLFIVVVTCDLNWNISTHENVFKTHLF